MPPRLYRAEINASGHSQEKFRVARRLFANTRQAGTAERQRELPVLSVAAYGEGEYVVLREKRENTRARATINPKIGGIILSYSFRTAASSA